MPFNAREKRIRAEAQRRGIERIRTKDLPGGKYAHVYITKQAGPRGGVAVMGQPQKKKGKARGKTQ